MTGNPEAPLPEISGRSERAPGTIQFVADTDRMRGLAAYVANTVDVVEAKLGGVEYGALFDAQNGTVDAAVSHQASEDWKLIESVRADVLNVWKAAIRAVRHLADPDYWNMVGDASEPV